MIKDLSPKLVAAVAAINQKSREAFVAEQQALQQKQTAKQLGKMPGVAAPKAETPAHTGAKKMAEEAGGTTPKTAEHKKLAALRPPFNKITHGDVLHGRGVKKEEVEQADEAESHQAKTTMKHIPNPSPALKKAAKDIKPGVSGYRDRIAMLKAGGVKEEVEQIDELSVETMKSAKEKLANKAYDAHMDDNKMGARNFAHRALKMGSKIKSKERSPSQMTKEEAESKKTDAFDYKTPRRPQDAPNRKSGDVTSTGHDVKKISTGTVYTKRFTKEENLDTPGNSTHQCAIHVKSEQFGEGRTLTSQHAVPTAEGFIAWYDVMFAEGIKRVSTEDIEVLVSESHMNHKKKKAK